MTTTPIHRVLASVLAIPVLFAGCGGGQESGPAEPAAAAEPTSEPAAPPAVESAAGPLGTATVAGVVRYEGEVPKLNSISMDADPGCAKKHASPVLSEMLVLGDDNTVGNVFVQVKSGLPGGSYPAPSEPVVIDQKGCRYVPHVVGVMRGQTLKILNSDGLLHNVHALPKVNKTFNMAMPASRAEAEVTFTEEEPMFKIKCDVHPWMGAYIAVVSHPFFSVTANDGRFGLSDLPAGTYEIEVWHEKLGTQSRTVEVADGQNVQLDFTLTR